MKISVSSKAIAWFKEEIQLSEGQGIRFFGKVYGKTQVHDGFSVGMSVDTPDQPVVEETIDGLLFFIDEADEWFFNGYDLEVDFDEKLAEPKYSFPSQND